MSNPSSVSELYPSKWITADRFKKGGPQELIITDWEIIEVKDRREGKVKKLALSYVWVSPKSGKTFEVPQRMICNLTQCRAIAEIAGAEEFEEWKGTTVVLSAGVAQNGKPTILVQPPPTPPKESAQEAEEEAETSEMDNWPKDTFHEKSVVNQPEDDGSDA